MALSRAKKSGEGDELASELEHSTSAIIGTFTRLTAAKDFELRKTVREAGGSYHVVKNKLAARAAKGTKIEAALQGLKGVSSVAYTCGDPVALAKALSTWVKDNAEFTFKLGIVDGKVINVEEIKALATMPGKEELFSKLLFLINVPGAAPGYRHQRYRPRPGRRHQPGRREGQVCRRPAARRWLKRGASAESRSYASSGCGSQRLKQPVEEAPPAEAAAASLRTPPHRGGSSRLLSWQQAHKQFRLPQRGALVWGTSETSEARQPKRQPRSASAHGATQNSEVTVEKQNGRHSAVGRSDR